MSTIVKKFDWSQINRKPPAQRSDRYPWGQWFDGRIHLLTQGVDFDSDPESFIRVARTSAARKTGGRASSLGIRIRRGPFDAIPGSTADDVIMQAHRHGQSSAYVVTTSKSFAAEDAARAKAAEDAKAERAAARAERKSKALHPHTRANGQEPSNVVPIKPQRVVSKRALRAATQ